MRKLGEKEGVKRLEERERGRGDQKVTYSGQDGVGALARVMKGVKKKVFIADKSVDRESTATVLSLLPQTCDE